MKKKSIIFFFSLFLINFVSAFSHYSYNRFSFSGFLDSIDPSTMILGALFIIFFAFLNMALGKVFKDQYGYPNKAIAGIVAFVVSTFMIWGINRFGFNIEGLFYGIGFSSDLLYIILPIILLAGAIYIVWRFSREGSIMSGLAALFLISGLFLMILTIFTDIFYEKGLVLIIGIALFLVGLWLWNSARRGFAAVGGSIWKGSKAAGRGVKYGYRKGKEKYGDVKEYRDPRSRLERREIKRQEATEKWLAREQLRKQKQQDKAHSAALREERKRNRRASRAENRMNRARRREG